MKTWKNGRDPQRSPCTQIRHLMMATGPEAPPVPVGGGGGVEISSSEELLGEGIQISQCVVTDKLLWIRHDSTQWPQAEWT